MPILSVLNYGCNCTLCIRFLTICPGGMFVPGTLARSISAFLLLSLCTFLLSTLPFRPPSYTLKSPSRGKTSLLPHAHVHGTEVADKSVAYLFLWTIFLRASYVCEILYFFYARYRDFHVSVSDCADFMYIYIRMHLFMNLK